MTRKTGVLFVINSLAAGGAERQLCELARRMDPSQFDLHVAVLYGPGSFNDRGFWDDMALIPGVSLHDLHKRKGPLGYLAILPRLWTLIRRTRVDILHGYLEGNLLVLLLGKVLHKRIVWGIRRSFGDPSKLDRMSRVIVWLLAHLARFVDLVISNSVASLKNLQAMGMRAARAIVIPNGFDVDTFAPDAASGLAQRQAWGIPANAPLIGIVGRLDPVKDHPAFLRAAARLSKDWPEAWFVCIGRGEDAYLQSLRELASSLGISARVRWTGSLRDMPSAYRALDVLALTSTDEGFPNAVGEAMASGVPCVVTPVGDAADLVADTGLVAPCGNDAAMAQAISRLLAEPGSQRLDRAKACRHRICATYSTEALAQRTGQELRSLLRAKRGPKYILRFDDICPTMNWAVWNRLEAVLIAHSVQPLLAVIPDNQDPSLWMDPPAADFWERVRAWQARGWAIGLHGYQHRYVNHNPGILGIGRRSEFAGLPYGLQHEKLRRALAIFARERITPSAWVAPSHSFDHATLAALDALGLRTISDGLALAPYRDPQGFTWVPQQFATPRAFPKGIWTFCHHLDDFQQETHWRTFEHRLEQLGPRMISFQEAAAAADRGRERKDDLVVWARKVVSGGTGWWGEGG